MYAKPETEPATPPLPAKKLVEPQVPPGPPSSPNGVEIVWMASLPITLRCSCGMVAVAERTTKPVDGTCPECGARVILWDSVVGEPPWGWGKAVLAEGTTEPPQMLIAGTQCEDVLCGMAVDPYGGGDVYRCQQCRLTLAPPAPPQTLINYPEGGPQCRVSCQSHGVIGYVTTNAGARQLTDDHRTLSHAGEVARLVD